MTAVECRKLTNKTGDSNSALCALLRGTRFYDNTEGEKLTPQTGQQRLQGGGGHQAADR